MSSSGRYPTGLTNYCDDASNSRSPQKYKGSIPVKRCLESSITMEENMYPARSTVWDKGERKEEKSGSLVMVNPKGGSYLGSSAVMDNEAP